MDKFEYFGGLLEVGVVPRAPHAGPLLRHVYEQEHGRGGFAGRVSHTYHLYPPGNWLPGETRILPDGAFAPGWESPLAPLGGAHHALAMRAPLLIAPAMDGGMYDHPATQENIEILKNRGATFIGPAEGHLASGLSGVGRMLETAEIIGHIRLLLGRTGPLAGKKTVVTAGGTQEPLDPVRVLTNRSSGRQGYALAQVALEMGAQVTLITTPTALTPRHRAEGRDRGTLRVLRDSHAPRQGSRYGAGSSAPCRRASHRSRWQCPVG